MQRPQARVGGANPAPHAQPSTGAKPRRAPADARAAPIRLGAVSPFAGPSAAQPQPQGIGATLPADVLAIVFAQVGLEEMIAAGQVCSAWRKACAASCERRGTLSISVVAEATGPEARAKVERALDAAAKRGGASDAGEREALAAALARWPGPLSFARAGALLRGPLGARPRRVRLVLLRATRDRPLAALRAALDAGLSLPPAAAAEVVLPRAGPREAGDVAPLLERLLLRHPALRELHLRHYDGAPLRIPDGATLPKHGALERLGAALGAVSAARKRIPSLKRVEEAEVREAAELRALAAAGVACRSLAATAVPFAASAAARADAAAVLRPREGAFAGCPTPARLRLAACLAPDSWPDGAFAGLQKIECEACEYEFRPAAFSWLTRGAHAASLRRVELDLSPVFLSRECLEALVLALDAMPPGATAWVRLSASRGPDSIPALYYSHNVRDALDLAISLPGLPARVQFEPSSVSNGPLAEAAVARFNAARARALAAPADGPPA